MWAPHVCGCLGSVGKVHSQHQWTTYSQLGAAGNREKISSVSLLGRACSSSVLKTPGLLGFGLWIVDLCWDFRSLASD